MSINVIMNLTCTLLPNHRGHKLMCDRAAYTEKPDLTGTGWAVTFCSKFFQGRYLKTITEGTQSKQLYNLISYEHTLVHEFMVGLT